MTSCNSCTNYEISTTDKNEEVTDNTKPKLNVFIENSGSMDGFVLDKSQFRDDLYDYISKLKGCTKAQNLYYINAQIIPIQEPLESFFTNLNVDDFKAKGGNRAHSDIVDMLGNMLSKADNNTVTLFASDCILDLPEGKTQSFFGLKKTALAEKIRQYRTQHEGFGFRILCMQSNFNGNLYPTGKAPIAVNGNRPYYIWIFGPNKLISQLMKAVPDESLGKDLKNCIAFSDISKGQVPNNVGKSKGAISRDGKVSLKSGNPKFDLYANLGRTLLDEKSIEDKGSYDLSPFLKIEGVSKINNDQSKYTHIIHLNLNHASRAENLKVALKKYDEDNLPKWVNDINDETGDKQGTTCGIKYLIQGIGEAFEDVPQLTINLGISKK